MISHAAYGLGIHSDFAIPEFLRKEVGPDVLVRLDPDEIPPDSLPEESRVDVGEDTVTLAFRSAGIFRVRGGREVHVHRAQQADLSLIRLYLVGKVLGTLLHQRGLLVLHASCVAVDGLAVAFMGTSCIGKSSLAATLHRCGAHVVADDVTAVDFSSGVPRAVPAFPQLKVDPSVAEALGHDRQTLIDLHPAEGRRGLRVEDAFQQGPVRLGLIYLVGVETQPEPQNLMVELIGQSYPARLLQSGGALHLRQCARLARAVPVRGLSIGHARGTPTELAARIRADLAVLPRPVCA